MSRSQIVHFYTTVPNCSLLHRGAKLPWCQIVNVFAMVPNCPPTWVVPNCPWCQIVLVPNCPRTVKVHPNCGSNSIFGVVLWKTVFNSWFDFPSIFTCGEIGPCSLSCCDMFTVQNLHQTIIPPHGSSTEIQAPSLSPCHLLIRTIPNMQKIYLWDTKYWLINHLIWSHLDNCNLDVFAVQKWDFAIYGGVLIVMLPHSICC